jgi:hypothetical protein
LEKEEEVWEGGVVGGESVRERVEAVLKEKPEAEDEEEVEVEVKEWVGEEEE